MESKYQCPYCQYMSLKKWNIDRHVKNIHRVKNFPDRNNVKLNIDPQNIRQLPCPIHSSDYRPNQEQQHDVIPYYHSKYQPSQEEHQYGKRFKDASTQYLENDINHSTIPLLPKKYLLSTLPFLQNLLLIKCNPIVIEPTNKMTFGKFKQDKLSDIGRVQAL